MDWGLADLTTMCLGISWLQFRSSLNGPSEAGASHASAKALKSRRADKSCGSTAKGFAFPPDSKRRGHQDRAPGSSFQNLESCDLKSATIGRGFVSLEKSEGGEIRGQRRKPPLWWLFILLRRIPRSLLRGCPAFAAEAAASAE